MQRLQLHLVTCYVVVVVVVVVVIVVVVVTCYLLDVP